MKVVQIVPDLPPGINGLGDQAYLLAQELARAHGIETHFLVCRDGRPNADWLFPVTRLKERTAQALFQILNNLGGKDVVIVLHYVGYGYSARGCPFWLLRGLEQWRQSTGRRRLITMFYEVYASGAPWQRSFWSSPLQRKIASKLARLSDVCRTNARYYATLLERISRGKNISSMPVFSNVGETREAKPYATRKHQMAVFGGAASRAAVYRHHLPELIRLFSASGCEELVDIGPRLSFPLELSVPFRTLDALGAPMVSEILQDTQVGIVRYPAALLAKSSIFAAYAAHGVAPIVLGNTGVSAEDEAQEGREYTTGEALSSGLLANLSRAVLSWYSQHDLSSTAKWYGHSIMSVTGRT